MKILISCLIFLFLISCAAKKENQEKTLERSDKAFEELDRETAN